MRFKLLLFVTALSIVFNGIAKNSLFSNPKTTVLLGIQNTQATGFNYTPSAGCAPLIVSFSPIVPGPTYNWNFGDPNSGTNNTSNLCNPVHIFNTPGVYTVTLVTNAGTFTETITVGTPPNIVVSGNATVCQNATSTYTASGVANNYQWQPEGGIVLNGQGTATADIQWTQYGINKLILVASNNDGCSKSFTKEVRVIPPPAVDLPCCSKLDKKVRNTSSNAGCGACLNSNSCYTASILPGFGEISDYNWTWTTTNGTIINGTNPNEVCITWNATGIAVVTLTIEHKTYGCKSTVKCEIEVGPGISPSFSVSNGCINTPILFDASLSAPISDIEKYEWDFGNGITKTTTDPYYFYSYSFPGNYLVSVTITTISGCEYKISKNISINSGTGPKISCVGTVCANSNHCYTTEAIAGASYQWSVTGATSFTPNGNSICINWGNGPQGKITVSVINGNYSCINTSSEIVPILSQIIPISAPNSVCNNSGGSVNFTAPIIPGACYSWSVTGGTISSSPNENSISVLYSNANTNDIVANLTVDLGLGCCKGTGTAAVKKLPMYVISGPYTVCQNENANYAITYSGSAPNVTWNFDNATPNAISGTTANVTWGNPTFGSITVINNSPNLYCNTTATAGVNVLAPANGEDLKGPELVCVGTTNTYFHGPSSANITSIVSVSPAAIVTSTANNSNITFTTPGTYTISVKYQFSNGNVNCSTTKTLVVKAVSNIVPAISGPTVACTNNSYTYNATLPDPSSFEWIVEGGTITSVLPSNSITVLWSSTVNSKVILKNKACGVINTLNVNVNGVPINYIKKVVSNCNQITLTASPTWNYSWSPGGQTTQTITVNTSGNYSVVVSNGICSTTTNVSVIMPTAPIINTVIITKPNQVNCPKCITLCPDITIGSAPISSYSWTFNGASPSSQSSPCAFIRLNNPNGSATYTLNIIDDNGCTSTYSGSVSDVCTPDTSQNCTFVGTFNTSYDPCTRKFTSTQTNTTDYFWEFGDCSFGTGLNPSHTFKTPCDKIVTVWVKDINGCKKKFSFTIPVPYIIDLTPANVSSSTVCGGPSAISVSGVQICPTSGYAVSYSWNISGSCFTGSFTTSVPTLNIASLPNCCYTATVNATVTNGTSTCIGSSSGSFCAGGLKAFFKSCGGCANSILNFSDLSGTTAAPLIRWQWNFGNGATSTLQNPQYEYTIPGNYTVSLTVTDNNGCISTYSEIITIGNSFNPGTVIVKQNGAIQSGNNFTICLNENWTLTAPAGYTYAWNNGASNQTITVTETKDYEVTVINNSTGCRKVLGPFKFILKPHPTAIMLGNLTGCGPVKLSAAQGIGYSYKWSMPPAIINATNVEISVYNSGSLSLSVTNAHGCISSVSNAVNVLATPTLSITPSTYQTICEGQSVTFYGSTNPPNLPVIWFNGPSTTNSVTINKPGNYWATIVHPVSGCSVRTDFTVGQGFKPELPLLPKGCYKTCKDVKFCAGTVPSGYTGQWQLNNTNYGNPIPSGQSIGQTFINSGTYNFILNAPAWCVNCCPYKSEPITLEKIPLPSIGIISNPNPAVICRNSGKTVLLEVNPFNPNLTYTWTLNGTIVGTGASYIASSGGVYTVTGVSSCDCDVTASIEVKEIDCCIENPSDLITPVPDGTVINSNTLWAGKYYIDGKVYVQGNATLDLTNVDCLFSHNGEIIFNGNSIIRATNSVFRPCQKDVSWIGLTFAEKSSGWINNSIFKNAQQAIYLSGNEGGVRVTNNTFSKCHTGYFAEKSANVSGVSGNSFEIDDNTPEGFPNNDYTGIKLYSTDVSNLLSQNEFRQLKIQNAPNRLFGISAIFSSFNATENTFVDIFRAIDVSNSSNIVAIEKNTIKINTLRNESAKAIVRASDCEFPTLIYQNQLSCSQHITHLIGGIFVANSNNVHIKENTINEFYVSINVTTSKNVHINNNHVYNGLEVGINVSACDYAKVSCNDVTMWLNKKNGNTCIGLVIQDLTENSAIYTNCINNCRTAVMFRLNNLGEQTFPLFKNNFLYNYIENGIYNYNYIGSIGTNTVFNEAGRNTFMSNNLLGGALDLNSPFTAISQSGNYGVLATNAMVTSYGPADEFNSTASCGHQITGNVKNNQLDELNECDIFANDLNFLWLTKSGEYWQLENKISDVSIGFINKNKNHAELMSMIQVYALKCNPGQLQNLWQNIASSELTKLEQLQIKCNYYLSQKSILDLENLLRSIPNNDENFTNIKSVLTATISMLKSGVKSTLEINEKNNLISIDSARSSYAAVARDLLHFNLQLHPYIFPEFKITTPEKSNSIVLKTNQYLNVYPVPSKDLITILFNHKLFKSNTLQIFDAQGRKIENVTTTIESGKILINITGLASGNYYVKLISDNQQIGAQTARFIKL